MGDPVPSSAISDATVGGLSVIVITGGSDGDVLTRQADGTYAPETPSAASGDVVGPSSATDNAVARFDATTGKLLQNSGVTIADTNATVITVTSAAAVPLCVKGAASQSANLQEWQNSSGTIVGFVTVGGAVMASTALMLNSGSVKMLPAGANLRDLWFVRDGADDEPQVIIGRTSGITVGSAVGTPLVRYTLGLANGTVVVATGANATGVLEINNGTAGTFRDLIVRNLGLNGVVSAGGGVGIQFLANATTVPTTNPTGGGVLYCEGGALKFRGSSGTVTTLGPA